MAHIVTCVQCKQRFDRDKVPFVQVANRRYAHKECSEQENLRLFKEEADKIDLDTYMVIKDITLEARFVEDSFLVKTMSNIDGGTYTLINESKQSNSSIELNATANSGYKFDGWYINDKLISASNFTYTTPKSDVLIMAKFSPIMHDINYHIPTGAINPNQTQINEFDSFELKNASLTGYSFAGWFKEDAFENEVTNYDYNVGDLYGKFVVNTYKLTLNTSIMYTVTFDYNYEGSLSLIKHLVSGETLEYFEPTREGYIFYGWHLDEECENRYNFNSLITSDLHLYAGWKAGYYGSKIVPINYPYSTQYPTYYLFRMYNSGSAGSTTIERFHVVALEGGTHYVYYYRTDTLSPSIRVTNVTKGRTISSDSISTSVKSISFTCDPGDIIELYFSLSSQGNYYVHISFSGFKEFVSSSKASSTVEQQVKYGSTIDFKDPIKPGYKFVGWYDNKGNYFGSKIYNVASDLTLYAKWEEE